uniref:Uncharacterized protein n=1 Tax=Heterorhabditis bacteriophora TaxID=37862 RepID=A0A1I7X5N5_HETBA
MYIKYKCTKVKVNFLLIICR